MTLAADVARKALDRAAATYRRLARERRREAEQLEELADAAERGANTNGKNS